VFSVLQNILLHTGTAYLFILMYWGLREAELFSQVSGRDLQWACTDWEMDL